MKKSREENGQDKSTSNLTEMCRPELQRTRYNYTLQDLDMHVFVRQHSEQSRKEKRDIFLTLLHGFNRGAGDSCSLQTTKTLRDLHWFPAGQFLSKMFVKYNRRIIFSV